MFPFSLISVVYRDGKIHYPAGCFMYLFLFYFYVFIFVQISINYQFGIVQMSVQMNSRWTPGRPLTDILNFMLMLSMVSISGLDGIDIWIKYRTWSSR